VWTVVGLLLLLSAVLVVRIGDRDIQQALVKVALRQLAIRLNDVRDWAKVLSVGEQQRIAFARILLSEPRGVFLDESTSAVEEGLELMLYELVRSEFPEAVLVSVSHRGTVEQFHGRHLELVGDGEWRLDALPTRSWALREGCQQIVEVPCRNERGHVQPHA
jgi:vitamin B12/bleomycin/antimicrobial peptide transport system ATP-binding/permease protein